MADPFWFQAFGCVGGFTASPPPGSKGSRIRDLRRIVKLERVFDEIANL